MLFLKADTRTHIYYTTIYVKHDIKSSREPFHKKSTRFIFDGLDIEKLFMS